MPRNIEDISDRPIPQRLIDDLREPLFKTGQGTSGLAFYDDDDEQDGGHAICLLVGGVIGFLTGMILSAFVR